MSIRSIEVHGLSATGVDQDEVIVMNGVTAVESSLTYIRVNLVHNETVGTYGGSHEGDIEIRVTNETFGSGALLATMTGEEGLVNVSSQYGLGEASNAYISVPLGKVLYIRGISYNVDAGGNATAKIILYEREGILNVSAPFDPRRVLWQLDNVTGFGEKEFKSHIKIKALTDLFFRAEISTGTASIDAEMEFYLVDADVSGA